MRGNDSNGQIYPYLKMDLKLNNYNYSMQFFFDNFFSDVN